ncbi:phosphate acyltransferase PlsX [Pelagibaculum spongiae]|uniref:Phosphate acyltransferase n=2 Tax=Pelagibaculum spongiae TaxID=2080658 RepID=A0A2V1GUR4_9GAMM|nr:phosphate acyltransferase PlsX [Pelagibaculum spongiae]
MSGDHGPRIILPAALEILKKYPDIRLILVGHEDKLRAELPDTPFADRLVIHHAEQVVEMDDSVSVALRSKKQSSMRVAINLVKEGKAAACVSAGNTGALMAVSRFVLKTIRGIDRPAIIATVPTAISHTHVLDLGANVDCTAEHLLQFALMGSVLISETENKPNPTVALLNIGSEDIKGNSVVKQASALLEQESSLNYTGYIEGNQINHSDIDLVVCDGFVGNVALKTSEGVAKFIAKVLKKQFNRGIYSRLIGLLALPILKRLSREINPDEYNGASLVGLRGVVVKSHGGAGVKAFYHAIETAITEARQDLPARIEEKLPNP